MSVLILTNAYFVDGLGLVPRMKGFWRDVKRRRWMIGRNNDTNGERYYFVDADYGDAARSCKAAIRKLKSIAPIVRPGTRTIVRERSDKKHPLNEPGVILREVVSRRHTWYAFVVSNPVEAKTEYFPIGTGDDLDEKWTPTLVKASTRRAVIIGRKMKKARLDKPDREVVESI